MEFARFESFAEFQYVSHKLREKESIIFKYLLVDGMTTSIKSKTEWFYTVNGQKISFDIPWEKGEPNDLNNGEYCMMLAESGESYLPYRFGDISCGLPNSSTTSQVLCQKS
jgi:hypothetical protein